jgi:hypothetical protein
MKAFIIDDSPVVREGLATVLSTVAGVDIVGKADYSLMTGAGLRAAGTEVAPIGIVLGDRLEQVDRRRLLGAGADHVFDSSNGFDGFLGLLSLLVRNLTPRPSSASTSLRAARATTTRKA